MEGVAPEVTEAAIQGQTVVYVGKFTYVLTQYLNAPIPLGIIQLGSTGALGGSVVGLLQKVCKCLRDTLLRT